MSSRGVPDGKDRGPDAECHDPLSLEIEATELHQLITLSSQEKLLWVYQFEALLADNQRLVESLKLLEETPREVIDIGIESIEMRGDEHDSFHSEHELLSKNYLPTQRKSDDPVKTDSEMSSQLEFEKNLNSQLAKEVEALRIKSEADFKTIEELELCVSELQDRLHKGLVRLSTASADVNRLREENGRLQGLVEEKDKSSIQLKEKVCNLEVHLDELRDASNRKETEILHLNEAYKQLSIGYERAQAALISTPGNETDQESKWIIRESQLLQELQVQSKEREEKDNQIQNMIATIANLRSQMEQVHSMNDLLEKQLGEVSVVTAGEIQKMSVDLECAKGAREVYERENQRLQARCEAIKRDIDKNVTDEILELHGRLEASEKEKEFLVREEANLRKLYNNLKRELERLRSSKIPLLHDLVAEDIDPQKEEHTFGGGGTTGFVLNVIPPDTIQANRLKTCWLMTRMM